VRCLEEINLKECLRRDILELSWLDNFCPDAIDFCFD